MAMKEAKEVFGKMLRWTEVAKNADQAEKTIFLGEAVQGFYVNKRNNVGQNESSVYELKLENGELVSFWGSDLLDGKFAEIPLGSSVRVTFLGIAQPKTPKGRAYQNFRVEYDDSVRAPMKEVGHPADQVAPSTATAPSAPVAPAAPAGDANPGY